MIHLRVILIFVVLACSSQIAGQSTHKLLRKGDKAYKQERFEMAEENYRKAIDKKPTANGSFNLGNTIYNQDRYEEAAQHYQQSVNIIGDDQKRSEALYNLGNAQLKNQQMEEAIESYKQAARINSEDRDIRNNLYLAKKLLEQKQQQEQQEQQQEQNQQPQEDNSEQQQNPQQQQQEGESEQEQQQSSQSDIDNQGGESPVPEQTQELSREDAEKLLQVIENEERNVQEKLRKMSGNKKKPKKDW